MAFVAVVKRMAILNSALRGFSFLCIFILSFIPLMARFTCVLFLCSLTTSFALHHVYAYHERKKRMDLFACIFYVYVVGLCVHVFIGN